jgi:hypothetical protein
LWYQEFIDTEKELDHVLALTRENEEGCQECSTEEVRVPGESERTSADNIQALFDDDRMCSGEC